MHKVVKSALALSVGVTLALAVPLSASAAVSESKASSVTAANVVAPAHNSPTGDKKSSGKSGYEKSGYGHKTPTPKPSTHKPYPPSSPNPPKHHFPAPFWWGGFIWIPIWFPFGSFAPHSVVHVFISGFGPFPFHGTFVADESGKIDLGSASADGSLTSQLKVAGAAAGQTYNLTFVDESGKTVSQSVSVPADVAKTASTATSVQSADPGSLAATGSYISVATVWGAAGLVALGAGFVVMRASVRRKDRAKV
jgi:hypothetical protein